MNFQERFKQSIWQIPALIILSGLIALGFNHWRTAGIPLIGNWSVEGRFSDIAGQPLVMDLAQAVQLFEQN